LAVFEAILITVGFVDIDLWSKTVGAVSSKQIRLNENQP